MFSKIVFLFFAVIFSLSGFADYNEASQYKELRSLIRETREGRVFSLEENILLLSLRGSPNPGDVRILSNEQITTLHYPALETTGFPRMRHESPLERAEEVLERTSR